MPSISWVLRRARGSHPLSDAPAKKFLVMLQCYMDDSGTHDGAHNCVIGGYWGGVKEWQYFEYQWKAALAAEGIQEFKANEFWPRPKGERIGAYKGWTDERHRKFIDSLLSIIEARKVYPFVCGALNCDWNNVPQQLRNVFAGYAPRHHTTNKVRPEFLCFQTALLGAAKYCKEGKLMHFILDDSQRAAHFAECYAELKRDAVEDNDNYRFKLGELTFADSKLAVPLQAADLLVYEAHRWAKKRSASGNADEPVRHEYRRALARFRTAEDFWMFDAARLLKLSKAVVATAREVVSRG